MIRSEKREFVALAAIAVLVLLAVVPLGSAATATIFADGFQSGNFNNWSYVYGGGTKVSVVSGDAYQPPWGGYYAKFVENSGSIRKEHINTTCMINITLSCALRTVNLESSDYFTILYDPTGTGGLSWITLAQYNDSLNWTTVNFTLPPAAENKPNLWIGFVLFDGGIDDRAYLDNVSVTGTVAEPALEVTKTVWNGTAWVKELTAKINDTLQFNCTITNTGNVNLTQIRYWDVLDCSLDCGNMFKPKVLHPVSGCDWDPTDTPPDETFMELCPELGVNRECVTWDDTNHDGNVSACDQVQLYTSPDYHWYHVDRVPYTLNLSNATYGSKYFDSVLNWDDPEMNLSDPINSTWLEVCCCKDKYTLLYWINLGCPYLDSGDLVTMRNERTQQVVDYTVEEVAKDLVVSEELEMDVIAGPRFILEPYHPIIITYAANVVRCGVDNNTFVAKGKGCGDNWTYSDPAVVTITVPCPDGDAADSTPAIKDLFTAGEDVYALAHNFAPHENVSIYITPVRTWAYGDVIAAYAIVGPVNTTTDENGSIGLVPNQVLVWPNSTPGQWHIVFDVFDDPDGKYEQGVDVYDFFEVRGLAAVPVVTPLGIVALIGLLSLIATSTLVRKRRN